MTRYLGGSDVGFKTPAGTIVAPNLTPDRETGIGTWSKADIIKAIQTGVTPEGCELSPIMPWKALAGLTKGGAEAIAACISAKHSAGQS
jgi:hypothetical protein